MRQQYLREPALTWGIPLEARVVGHDNGLAVLGVVAVCLASALGGTA